MTLVLQILNIFYKHLNFEYGFNKLDSTKCPTSCSESYSAVLLLIL